MSEHHPRVESMPTEDFVDALDVIFEIIVPEHWNDKANQTLPHEHSYTQFSLKTVPSELGCDIIRSKTLSSRIFG